MNPLFYLLFLVFGAIASAYMTNTIVEFVEAKRKAKKNKDVEIRDNTDDNK